jgi:hypothetical protein
MGTITGLTHPALTEHNGLLYLTGYRDGGQYLRKSADSGKSWLQFRDGSDEKLICQGADEARAGLIKMESQGRRLVVAVAREGRVAIYVSADEGEQWVWESEL